MDTKSVPSLNDGNVKKTKGRQKIEMKKISNERYLQATFSKRRTGIFKKASELATLCDVDLAVIVFSPGNRVFSFGSPHVDSVIQRYIAHALTPPTLDLNEPFCTMDERGLHAHLDYLANRFTREKKREEDLNRLLEVSKNHFWWTSPIESMNKAQVENYKKALEDLKTLVNKKREKLLFKSTVLTYNSSTHFFCRWKLLFPC